MDVRLACLTVRPRRWFQSQSGKTMVEHILALLPIWIAVVGATLWITGQFVIGLNP